MIDGESEMVTAIVNYSSSKWPIRPRTHWQ